MANDERVKFDWKQNDGIKESSQKATRQDLTKNSKVKGMRMKLEKIEKKNTCQLDKVYILCINVRLPVYWSANTAALSPLHLPLSLAFILRTMWVYMSVRVVSGTMSNCRLFNNDNVWNSWAKWLTLFCWAPTAIAAAYTVNLLYVLPGHSYHSSL